MPVKKKAAPKKTAKKAPVPKQPVVPFNMVLLRGDGFKEHDKQAIFKYMTLKNHKQATSAVVDAVHGWFRQADTIQQLIKEKNELIDQLAKTKSTLRTLHNEVKEVVALECKLIVRKTNMEALAADINKILPADDIDQDDDNDIWGDDDDMDDTHNRYR